MQAVVDELQLEDEQSTAAAAPAPPRDVGQKVNRRVVRNAADGTRALTAVEPSSSMFLLVWRAGDDVLLQVRN